MVLKFLLYYLILFRVFVFRITCKKKKEKKNLHNKTRKVNGVEFDFMLAVKKKKKSLEVFTFYKWTSVCSLVKSGAINMSLNEMIM